MVSKKEGRGMISLENAGRLQRQSQVWALCFSALNTQGMSLLVIYKSTGNLLGCFWFSSNT